MDKVASVSPPACRPRLSTDQTRNGREQVRSVFLIIVNDDLRFLSDVIKIPRVTCTDKTEGKKKKDDSRPRWNRTRVSPWSPRSKTTFPSRRKLSNIRMKCYLPATTFHLQERMKIFGFGEFVFRMLKCLPTLVSGCQWIELERDQPKTPNH